MVSSFLTIRCHLLKHIAKTWEIEAPEDFVSIRRLSCTNKDNEELGAVTHDTLQLQQKRTRCIQSHISKSAAKSVPEKLDWRGIVQIGQTSEAKREDILD